MKTLYIDHNVLTHEDNWENLRGIVANHDIRLVISGWNMIEIEQGEDREQKVRRIEFILSLTPIYIHEMQTLQRYELRSFLWLYFFRAGMFPFIPFKVRFSSILLDDFNIRVRDDYSMMDYMQTAKLGDLASIEKAKSDLVNVLTTLQKADRRRLKELDETIFITHLNTLFPKQWPDGTSIVPKDWLNMGRYCYQNREKLYRSSPALLAESAMADKRRQDSTRKPNRGDAADLMHCTLGLAYCDYFVTGDGFAAKCTEYAQSQLKAKGVRAAAPFKSLQAFCDHLR
ncbi:hypothetical protein [Collimonas humicola]|uniref:hypothetical protein n=1 Tax=Collimonas humicola TaxID=2825886 RepID=UPI001B8B4D26|nr:hypothetical protein [Collimonas humicola]